MSKNVEHEYIVLYQCYICGLQFVDAEGTMTEYNSRAYKNSVVLATIICKECRSVPDEKH